MSKQDGLDERNAIEKLSATKSLPPAWRHKLTGTVYASVNFNDSPIAEVTGVAGHKWLVERSNLEPVVSDERFDNIEQAFSLGRTAYACNLIQDMIDGACIAQLQVLLTYAYQLHEDTDYAKKLERRMESKLNNLKGKRYEHES